MARKVKTTVTFKPTVASYPWIDKPDTGHKFSDNKYKTTLLYDDVDDAVTVKENGNLVNLQDVCERLALAEWGDDFDLEELRVPIRMAEDQTREDYEGMTTITAKSKYAPMAYDAKRNKLPKKVKIFGGDVVSVIATLLPYESTEKVREGKKVVTVTTYGISAQLSAIQLVEKRAGGGAGPEGFDSHEGGFDGSGYEDQDDEDQDDEEDNNDDSGDF